MDPIRAERMFKELSGQEIDGWKITHQLGAGKSALVLAGEREGKNAAIKVFDPELVQRFSKETQLERIKRECSLSGCEHGNLVKIYGGGECPVTKYLYVVMELVDAPNLHSVINLVPRNKISQIIQQVASAAKFLEDRGMAHRDIKPENIAIKRDFEGAVLLDLGVLRPFGDSRITDEDGRIFIGTLMYSSPEFLMRNELDSIEGWRAVSFYQLGAVLHDLIMQKPIFSEFCNPYPLLVQAVKEQKPDIRADDVSPDLILLAQNCLTKDPAARLKLVNWDSFMGLTAKGRSDRSSVKERVARRIMQAKSESATEPAIAHRTPEEAQCRILERIEQIVRAQLDIEASLPPKEVRVAKKEPYERIDLIFSKSPTKHQLHHRLAVCFRVTLINAADLSIQLFVNAFLLPDSDDNDEDVFTLVAFSGPLDSPVLAESISSFIWEYIDLAQQAGLVTAANTHSHQLKFTAESEE